MCQLSLNLVNSNISNKSKQEFILIDFSYYLLFYNNLDHFFIQFVSLVNVCAGCCFIGSRAFQKGWTAVIRGCYPNRGGPKAEGAGRLSGGLRALEFSGYSAVVVPSEPDVANI